MHPQLKAFLGTIAFSELGHEIIDASDDGYNVLVGSLPGRVKLFDSYDDHPRQLVKLSGNLRSSAAGRYQILARIFDAYRGQLRLIDFGKTSQDRIAIKLINECEAMDDIIHGDIRGAIAKCASRWASFPGAGYGQREHRMDELLAEFKRLGGAVLYGP